ncbi:hypothetical protein DMA11_18180 [Marinilabiliaceae bacterium JC017]|nr:hypothetical protein DMA11_18180 [Marinilabiliaceae bacterium JC017]
MINYFLSGGWPGMLMISICGLSAITWGAASLLSLLKSKEVNKFHFNAILLLGSLSLFIGLLWQAMGIFDVLSYVQEFETVSPSVLAAGIKASMIAPIAGAILFIISAVFWLLLHMLAIKK